MLPAPACGGCFLDRDTGPRYHGVWVCANASRIWIGASASGAWNGAKTPQEDAILAKPIVAVVGRPNVGKSTFFNYLVGKRVAIIEDTPGVTRDRIYAEAEWRGRPFMLIDTGGIEPHTDDYNKQQMVRQAQIAIETADVILFMVDIRTGLTPRTRKSPCCCANPSNPLSLRSTRPTALARCRRRPTNSTTWAWAKSTRFPPSMDWEPAICSTPCSNTSPPRGDGRGERCHQGGDHRQAQCGQILADQPAGG